MGAHIELVWPIGPRQGHEALTQDKSETTQNNRENWPVCSSTFLIPVTLEKVYSRSSEQLLLLTYAFMWCHEHTKKHPVSHWIFYKDGGVSIATLRLLFTKTPKESSIRNKTLCAFYLVVSWLGLGSPQWLPRSTEPHWQAPSEKARRLFWSASVVSFLNPL